MLWTCNVCGRIGPWETRHCPRHPPRPRSSSKQQRFRDAVLKRDDYRCVRCGSTQRLVAAHYPIPLRDFDADDPKAYDPSSGETMCERCHQATDHPRAR